MEDLEPLAPQAPIKSPPLVDDYIDDQPDTTPSKVELAKERDAAVRAEHFWQCWDIKSQTFIKRRLNVSAERWSWWKSMRTHNACPVLPDDDTDVDLDCYAPLAWSMLWLCLHEPDEILSLVVTPVEFWLKVNVWAQVHCQPARWAEAITLLNAIRTDIALLITVPLPTRNSRRVGE